MKNLRLKAARAGLDLSQADLAAKVGVSRQRHREGRLQPDDQPLHQDLQSAREDAG